MGPIMQNLLLHGVWT